MTNPKFGSERGMLLKLAWQSSLCAAPMAFRF